MGQTRFFYEEQLPGEAIGSIKVTMQENVNLAS